MKSSLFSNSINSRRFSAKTFSASLDLIQEGLQSQHKISVLLYVPRELHESDDTPFGSTSTIFKCTVFENF